MRVLAATLLALLIAACSGNGEIVIGFAGQLTGPMSDLGVQGRNGATLAVEELNAAGGILGRKLRLEAADDAGDSSMAVQADRKLLDSGAVAVIGHMTSGQTMAALPWMAEKGALLVSPTTATPSLTGIKDNFFRTIPDSASWATALARHAAGPMSLKGVVLMGDTDNDSYVDTFLSTFEKAFQAEGGTVKARRMFSSKAGPDWMELAVEASRTGAGAVVLAASARDVAAFARAAHKAGARTAILCPAWPYTREILHAGGESVEGIIFSTSYTEENSSPSFTGFRERYEKRFGWPPNFAAAYSYEAVALLAEALRLTGGRREGLGEALVASGVVHGVIGDFSLDPSGDVRRDTFIVTISGGRFRTVGTGARP